MKKLILLLSVIGLSFGCYQTETATVNDVIERNPWIRHLGGFGTIWLLTVFKWHIKWQTRSEI